MESLEIEATHKKKYYANEAVLLNSTGIGSPVEDSSSMLLLDVHLNGRSGEV